MSHQKIIQDLIAWIDVHIDQPLNIDVVAKNQAIQSGTCNGCSAR
ncbi:regulatory protein soxS [Shigella flexneri K-404]|nr:regulatory protein soxS [Shigella flexneri K-404]